MAFDSSTLCARTASGEAELATPSQGLSLGQRRVLSLMQDPVAVDELAQRHHLEPEKLARDLTRLAELRLIVLQGPAIVEQPAPPVPTPRVKVAASMTPVVIGPGSRRLPVVPLAAGATALALAVGIWYGTRSVESTTTSPHANLATTTAQPVATVPKPIGTTLPDTAPQAIVLTDNLAVAQPPASARVPRDASLPSDARPAARPVMTVATAPEKATAAPIVAAPRTTPLSEPAGATPPQSWPAPTSVAAPSPVAVNAPPPAAVTSAAPPQPLTATSVAQSPPATATSVAAPPPATAPSAAPSPAATNAPPPVAAPLREREPPVQLAAAAPSSTAARPAAPAGLKAISREPPDFPKEAIADGLRSGLVNARIHVDARGNVTTVDILGSQPPKVFDRAARRALLRWQFEPNATGQSTELEVDVKFQRD